MIIDHFPGLEPIKALGQVGRRNPAHSTSIGKVLLAFADEPTCEAILAGPLAVDTASTIADPCRPRAELAGIRRCRFGFSRAELQQGLSAVSAPIWDHRGALCAVVNVAGPYFRLPDERLLELSEIVLETATAISRDVGGKPDARPWSEEGSRALAPTSAWILTKSHGVG